MFPHDTLKPVPNPYSKSYPYHITCQRHRDNLRKAANDPNRCDNRRRRQSVDFVPHPLSDGLADDDMCDTDDEMRSPPTHAACLGLGLGLAFRVRV